MGAKQSKRSVDISGKEAEGAGEVAAAGAVGEGRVEQLADADALKPQLNGDAQHIHEHTDKEKQLDSGTPENEKDATTEKEAKDKESESGKEKDAAPVTNGDSEPKAENGESTPAPEEGKKPKKEKVKKKWSLRSISFSRKDKPKQEKKQKDEEPKTNGEQEKLPEEAAEATPETPANEVAEEAKPESETKDEKTPETPVTEPLTNGSSTPESPTAESPVEEPAAAPATHAPAAEPERQEPKTEVQPEQLPVNGLSIEEPKPEAPEQAQAEESKPEEPTAETKETVPAPEIPVKKEVCVDQMPLETTPPPLPANPPPSSVASFAATTMAPELTDASLVNTAAIVITAPHSAPDTTADTIGVSAPAPQTEPTNIEISNNEIVLTNNIVATEFPPPLKDTSEDMPVEVVKEMKSDKVDQSIEEKIEPPVIEREQLTLEKIQPEFEMTTESNIENIEETSMDKVVQPPIEKAEQPIEQLADGNVERPVLETVEHPALEKIEQSEIGKINAAETAAVIISEPSVDAYETIQNECSRQATGDQVDITDGKALNQDQKEIKKGLNLEVASVSDFDQVQEIGEISSVIPDAIDDLPPPPPPIEDEILVQQAIVDQLSDIAIQEKIEIVQRETVVNSNHVSEITDINGLNMEHLNGNDEIVKENLKNKTKDSLGNLIDAIECNGNIDDDKVKLEVEETTLAANDSTVESGVAATPEHSAPPSLSEANESLAAADGGSDEASEAFPPPPSARDLQPSPPAEQPQEPLPVSDKLADLIPEVPVVPELKTEMLTETTSDVAVAN